MEVIVRKVGRQYVEATFIERGENSLSTGTMDLLDAVCLKDALKKAVDDLDEYIHEKATEPNQ